MKRRHCLLMILVGGLTGFIIILRASFADGNQLTAEFDTGANVNEKMKTLANGSSRTYFFGDATIQAIKRGNSLPNDFTPTTTNTVSSSTSKNPIYIWY